jgi:hypothetical protein
MRVVCDGRGKDEEAVERGIDIQAGRGAGGTCWHDAQLPAWLSSSG